MAILLLTPFSSILFIFLGELVRGRRKQSLHYIFIRTTLTDFVPKTPIYSLIYYSCDPLSCLWYKLPVTNSLYTGEWGKTSQLCNVYIGGAETLSQFPWWWAHILKHNIWLPLYLSCKVQMLLTVIKLCTSNCHSHPQGSSSVSANRQFKSLLVRLSCCFSQFFKMNWEFVEGAPSSTLSGDSH